ncbi:flagellar export chaperone FliS [Pseudokineococcus sp. 1T1Z-3]|uniref:flagellar export chaperone FliS n=1 Tax=Pseudokineococcus sp. 1T1Z-3 TaxID=3132745 RepID=UPI0030A3F292
MHNPAAARARFMADAVATASPAKLLTMLYDRLVLDLSRAERAQETGDRGEANTQLQHAQDVVTELHASLDTSGAWAGAAGLAGLYTFLASELVEANVTGDPARTASCRAVVEPLREAWHQAAAQVGQGAPAVPAQRAGSSAPAGGLLSVSA